MASCPDTTPNHPSAPWDKRPVAAVVAKEATRER